MMKIKLHVCLPFVLSFLSCNSIINTKSLPDLQISENKRFLAAETGVPFFWLGDTGWLLFSKLNREEAEKYFEDRHQKGFNVIQVMVLHNVKKAVNFYGDSALINCNIDQPLTTTGNSPDDPAQYDYWDHIDYLINLAQKKGLYMAIVPVWGTNIRNGSVTGEKAGKYALWLAERYKDKSNVIWINGGDIRGSDSTAIWNTMGSVIRQNCPGQLITFHPFGRTQSSTWFHDETWLDFNMFQSGHRRYDQDTLGLCYGEDNWKYVVNDYAKIPVKPTMDGEPSYEGIPQGLHDAKQPYWTDADVRRYAYWSVFAGGCGFTYGNNAVMQFHKKDDKESSYGVKDTWELALKAPGALQMRYLKKLMLSRSYYDRIPAQELIADNQGKRHDYLTATRGKEYAFIYTCNGSVMNINLGKMQLQRIKASWYNPRNGACTLIGTYNAEGIKSFDPPGEKEDGNDWVLLLDRI
jgi:hypothetical protein